MFHEARVLCFAVLKFAVLVHIFDRSEYNIFRRVSASDISDIHDDTCVGYVDVTERGRLAVARK